MPPQFIHQWRQTKFAELTREPASPDIELGLDSSAASRSLIIHWDSWTQAASDFLGYAEVKETGGQKYINRVLPHLHPEFTYKGKPFLPAVSARLSPYPVSPDDGRMSIGQHGTAVARYKYGKLTLNYASVPWEIVDDANVAGVDGAAGVPDEARWQRYVILRSRPSAEIVGLPGNSYKYVNDNTAATGTPGKLIPKADIEVTWVQVPKEAVGTRSINPAASSWPIDECLGHINKDTVLGRGAAGDAVYAVGTLLLTAVNIEPHKTFYGTPIYNITYFFAYSPEGHYTTFKVTGTSNLNTFQELIINTSSGTNTILKSNGVNVYNWRDFGPLFRPPQ